LKVSIVIRAFNEAAHIGRLFDGINNQICDHDIETILVDSGSTDETAKIAKRHKARIVKIRPEEFSFGRALNIGCAAASGEILIFASAHVYPVYHDWIQTLVAPFIDDKKKSWRKLGVLNGCLKVCKIYYWMFRQVV